MKKSIKLEGKFVMIEKYKNIDEALNDLHWKHIGDQKITEIKQNVAKYFDIEQLDKDNSPLITAKNKTVFVCDNSTWNTTYLIDIVSAALKYNFPRYQLDKCDLVYCDSPLTRAFLQKVNYNDTEKFLANKDFFEKQVLNPLLIVINPEKKCIVMIKEFLAPLTYKQVNDLVMYLDDVYCDKQMNA